MWDVVSDRMRDEGFDRPAGGVRNAWNRWGRELAGPEWDERKTKREDYLKSGTLLKKGESRECKRLAQKNKLSRRHKATKEGKEEYKKHNSGSSNIEGGEYTPELTMADPPAKSDPARTQGKKSSTIINAGSVSSLRASEDTTRNTNASEVLRRAKKDAEDTKKAELLRRQLALFEYGMRPRD